MDELRILPFGCPAPQKYSLRVHHTTARRFRSPQGGTGMGQQQREGFQYR
jgi:hypothetical protein